MKTLIAGTKANFVGLIVVYCIVLVGMVISVVIMFDQLISGIFLFIGCIAFAAVVPLYEPDYFNYIQIDARRILLKQFSVTKQAYRLADVPITFSVVATAHYPFKPCLVFGQFPVSKDVYHIEDVGYRRGSKFFIVCLDDKKWEYLSKYCNKPIEISPDVENYKALKKTNKKIRKFHQLVTEHNKKFI